jgi:hypothetical protein
VIVIIVPAFAGLCAWQVDRALSGNQLSWAYVFEWPFFAGYAIYMWWRFIHEATPENAKPIDVVSGPHHPAWPDTDTAADADPDVESDAEADERAAYNHYLAQLATQDKRKQWR